MANVVFSLLISALASQAEGAGPIGHWKLDGDVQDSGPSAIPTQAVGRLEFIDSPIGGSGKMAVFNGVDSLVEITPATDLGKEYTLCAWVFLQELKPTVFFNRTKWGLRLNPDGALDWAGNHADLRTVPQTVLARQWMHLAMTQKKTDVGFEKTLWLSGDRVG